MDYLLFIAIGYLSGSIMYAYLLPLLFKHIDIRALSDDGNPGTANAFTHAGIPIGILVIICELSKGALPVWAAVRSVDISSLLFALVMAAPVLGHAYPLFQKGKKGGKAIAVSFGVLLGLCPNLAPLFILAGIYIFFSLIIIIKPHFYRSVITFALFSVCCLCSRQIPVSIALGCTILSVIVTIAHYEKYRGERIRFTAFHHRRKDTDNQPTL